MVDKPDINLHEQPLKRYYSISEVAKMFGVSTSLIRFWESEFNLLKPHKNSKGERRFTEQNINQLRIIYNLVKERGFTLEGARREIKNNRERLARKFETIERLQELKRFLERLKGEL